MIGDREIALAGSLTVHSFAFAIYLIAVGIFIIIII